VDFSWYDGITYADAYHLKFRDAQFFTPSTYFYLVHAKGSANPAQFDYEALDVASDGFIIYTTAFLTSYLKDDTHARLFLQRSPEQAGFADSAIVLNSKSGLTPPPSEGTFVNLYLERGSETARKVWDRVARDNPDYVIATANTLNQLGYTLIGQGETEEAVEAFKMQTDAYPNVSNAWDSMGEGYMANGDDELAIEAFETSLTMNPPQNVKNNSISLLGQLGVDYIEPEPYTLAEDDVAWIVGKYEVTANNQTNITEVRWTDGQLLAQAAGQPAPVTLIPQSPSVFWAQANGNMVGVTMEFVKDDGTVASQVIVTPPNGIANPSPRVTSGPDDISQEAGSN
jgi:tetratricopeptide (TPR) repeat protein